MSRHGQRCRREMTMDLDRDAPSSGLAEDFSSLNREELMECMRTFRSEIGRLQALVCELLWENERIRSREGSIG